MSGAATDSYLRGFSFMPESKSEKPIEMQYIEEQALEHTWKTSRRQRLRQQEQKIWEEFVKEQDILSSVCEDDPYQFLEQLPDAYLKEIMEIELQKMKKETELEKQKIQEEIEEQTPHGDGDSPRDCDQNCDDNNDNGNDNECDMILIFDDDERSGAEDEHVNGSSNSPCTVRERQEEGLSPVSLSRSPDKGSSKSSENVCSMIESSINCAKIRDLRIKIKEELLAIISSLEQRCISAIDPEQLVKMCRRSTEFCARFSRIYMYQLQRQMHDMQRHNASPLPLARHTQYQAQAARASSLHHNLLQALTVFHKSLEQTVCSLELALSLPRAVVQVSHVCRAVPTPKQLSSASDLYNDDIATTCEKLEEVLAEYANRMSGYLDSVNNSSRSKKSSKSGMKKRSIGTWSKSGAKMKSNADSRLSMYSLDTLRATFPPKSTSSKDIHSGGTSKMGVNSKQEPEQSPAKPKKCPHARRPLMRAPRATRVRAPLEHDLSTMVEAVGPCTPSHMSREGSPRQCQRVHNTAQHGRKNTPRKSQCSTPRRKNATTSPKNSTTGPRNTTTSPRNTTTSPKNTRTSPRPKLDVAKDPLATAESSRERIEQVAKMLSDREQAKALEASSIPEANTTAPPLKNSPRPPEEVNERDINKASNHEPARCEVTRIVRQLCGGDTVGGRNERVSGAKNAQLFCISGSSPRQPSTPQLLKILEETIQKKAPKTMYQKPTKSPERFRLAFNIDEGTADRMFQYRTKFVQHMLTSPMYANSTVGKPWELIGSVSEKLINELLLQCVKEMQLQATIQELYKTETC